ncbi:NAD-dependent epimerase/dehydratase family protein [Aquimarina algicola]|uniref:NAD-dependent epimerase/dehydratase family protein n=1 Tax=Aquimarina algicola TaxID=2589995 RepID=A0A504J0I5_9FLAO|nr:NAD-dependent epimerase/dehydratase family protein [Aquimarina algicola]TPN83914.1 NAD-dependent epimerase/dehydratase family protein [Aquimarina algicola]
MKHQISILGLGWLGLPLASSLIRENYKVKGSTTSSSKTSELEKNGILTFLITLEETGVHGDIVDLLKESETLIINVPPGLRRNPNVNFVSKIRVLIPYIEASNIENVLFVSSTSVFSDMETFPLITEKTIPNATSNAGKQLIEAEQLLQKNDHFKTTILRFSGLFGPNRHPATMLSKRSNIKNPNAPVNLIHLDDCIKIIHRIIKTEHWNEVFNASYPDHPEKYKYYSNICKQMELPIPDYDFNTPSKGKIISSEKVQTVLEFKYNRSILLL